MINQKFWFKTVKFMEIWSSPHNLSSKESDRESQQQFNEPAQTSPRKRLRTSQCEIIVWLPNEVHSSIQKRKNEKKQHLPLRFKSASFSSESAAGQNF